MIKVDKDKVEIKGFKPCIKAELHVAFLKMLNNGFTDDELGEVFMLAVAEYAHKGGKVRTMKKSDADLIMGLEDLFRMLS